MHELRTCDRLLVLLMLASLIVIAGCRSHEDAADSPRRFAVKGLVMELEPSQNRIVLAHDDIPHYMKAMTMAFTVADSAMLRALEVGDSVRAVLVVRKSGVSLDSVVVFARDSAGR
ncbi:MAG TPA: copper-binding protein [Bacteroidota bacterium]|nr:copper-binding protein [Bacteroidota bacterium]